MKRSQMLPRGSGDAGASPRTKSILPAPRVATHPPQGGADGEAVGLAKSSAHLPPVGNSLATRPASQTRPGPSPEGAAIVRPGTVFPAPPLEHAEMPEPSGGDSGQKVALNQGAAAAVSKYPSQDGGESATMLSPTPNGVASPLAKPMSGQPDGESATQPAAQPQTAQSPLANRKRRKARAADQIRVDTHSGRVSGATKRGKPRGESGANGAPSPIRGVPPLATTIAGIRKLGGRRRFLIKAQIRMDNSLGAYIRDLAGWRRPPDEAGAERAAVEKANDIARKRAAKLIKDIESGKPTDDPLAEDSAMLILSNQQARSSNDSLRDNTEKEMKRLAKGLGVYPWVKAIAGFGDLGLAIIVAEAGDVGSYKSVAALWKRCGLAVINGERQRRHSDVELAGIHGYSPRRRAEIWTLADSMFKHQWAGANETTGAPPHPVGPYGEAYGRKKADYMQRVVNTTELPYGHADKWTPKRADNAARRYMTKCLLRDLYGAWRRATSREANPMNSTSPANNSDAAPVASGERTNERPEPKFGSSSRTSSDAA